MVECTHCDRELPYDRQCWECGEPFCHAHEQPLMHDCPGLENRLEECTQCGTHTRDGRSCSRCGQPFCQDHYRRTRHDCSPTARRVASSSNKPLSEIGDNESQGLLSRVIPGRR